VGQIPFAVVLPEKSPPIDIIDDLQIRVKWVTEGQRPVEAALQADPG
jgi:hypothetical protein